MKKRTIILIIAVLIMLVHNCIIYAEVQDTVKRQALSTKTDTIKAVTTNQTKDPGKNISKGITGDESNNILLLESLENPEIKPDNKGLKYEKNEPEKKSENHDWKDEDHHWPFHNNKKFRGHWTGIELGFNNYVTSDGSSSMPPEIDYMTLHSGKSINFDINFAQISLPFSHHIGFVTGLGINWNNYKFDGDNNIKKGDYGVIEKLDPGVALKKSKLATIYLTMPMLLEFHIPANDHNLNIAAGGIGALKLDSHTKMVTEDDQKFKDYGDFSLNLLRYGVTARVGFMNFQVFGTYYFTPLFQSGKSPGGIDLYPFEVGLALTFND